MAKKTKHARAKIGKADSVFDDVKNTPEFKRGYEKEHKREKARATQPIFGKGYQVAVPLHVLRKITTEAAKGIYAEGDKAKTDALTKIRRLACGK